jgi:alpha-glucosidase
MRVLTQAVSAVVVLAALTPAFAKPLVLASPDGSVKVEVSDDGGAVHYAVSLDGKPVLGPSRVSIQSDGVIFGNAAMLGKPQIREVSETYAFFGGKSKAVNHARVATIPLTTNGERYALDVHVADDGVGVRLRLPAKAHRKVEADLSTWALVGAPVVWVTGYEPGYERPYKTTSLHALGGDSYGLPLTAKVGNSYVTLSEAALIDYGELAIKRQENGTLAGFLPTDWKGWRTDQEVVQPWRVTIVARNLTTLVNTTLIQNLNPPPDASLANADWIIPGRSAWQWMAVGAPELEDQHRWVDWTQSLGFEYYLVDEGWSEWEDAWAALKSVCDYAKTKGIKIWLWAHSREVADAQVRKEYFRRAAEIGIVGIKIDFPEPANHWWSTWYRDTARDAAAYKLLVDFHGAAKPTGMERTWPNELTREAVRGHEYHITRYNRVLDPQHDTILPFTRYVIGRADYTPTVFEKKELQGNTWAHELAQAVVYTSPFLCFGGNPRDYIDNPARDVLSAVPATWDETLVLPGTEPGKLAAVARRHGDQWFIGVLNGADTATLDISLKFLGKGTWRATRLGDTQDKPDAWDRREEQITSEDSFKSSLAPRGGFVAWIRK